MMPDKFASLAEDVHQYLTTASASEFFQQPVAFRERLPGREHLVWHVQANGNDYVAKFFLDAGQARCRRQFDGQQIFSSLGLAPAPRWYDRYPVGLSRQILVYEWQPGVSLVAGQRNQFIALAQAIGSVHQAGPVGHGRLSPRPVNLDFFWRILEPGLVRTNSRLEVSNATVMAGLVSRLSHAAASLVASTPNSVREAIPQPIHGDLSPENIVLHEGQAYLLDWELFGLGDPAQEIADFIFKYSAELDDHRRAFLDVYAAVSGIHDVEDRIELYLRLLPLHSLDYLLQGLAGSRAAARIEVDAQQFTFMLETVLATLRQSMLQLGVVGNATDAVTQLFHNWFPAQADLIQIG